MENVKVTFRGWKGHFCCGNRCRFGLNTLLEYKDTKIVVSTVGALYIDKKLVTIGCNRYYETRAFHAKRNKAFWDADVTREVSFESEWCWSDMEDEWKANKGHHAVIEELSKKLLEGNKLKD